MVLVPDLIKFTRTILTTGAAAQTHRRPWKWSIPTPARSSHRRQHNAAADPAAYNNAKSTKAPPEGASCINCYHRLWFTISPPCWLPFTPPFTIGGERLDTRLPGLSTLAGGEPRVQTNNSTRVERVACHEFARNYKLASVTPAGCLRGRLRRTWRHMG